jgi:hypothetical protein
VCPGYYPLVRPGFAASQVFVYHPDAIKDFRGYATERFFPDTLAKYQITAENFLTTWNAITQQQLVATLTWLPPANKVARFNVNVAAV